MQRVCQCIAVLGVLVCIATSTSAESMTDYLNQYFKGAAIKFGYGSGTSSNNPRVELIIQYCANGTFYSTGQSCRPNIIAKGYQCSNVQDYGQWQVREHTEQLIMQWYSPTSGPGAIAVYMRDDGTVVDQQGNPFSRVGQAQCR